MRKTSWNQIKILDRNLDVRNCIDKGCDKAALNPTLIPVLLFFTHYNLNQR